MLISQGIIGGVVGTGHPEQNITIDGQTQTLRAWVAEFNDLRASFNGSDFVPYDCDEVTRHDLALEFAAEAYEAWDGRGLIEL